ncbi:MAG TPA: RDD family protein, partial [Thermoanaerobaculia bacterium]|nr:RDD family protein [Thermoanaerobaculia bacterium]
MSAVSLDRARVHPVLTPEGLSLPFVVGSAGDRISAFLFDTALIVLATLGVWALAALGAALGLKELGVSFALLMGFLLWNFYFIYFEAHRGGVTFGKRKAELRVISRDGGPLTAEAVVARNLMRNLE